MFHKCFIKNQKIVHYVHKFPLIYCIMYIICYNIDTRKGDDQMAEKNNKYIQEFMKEKCKRVVLSFSKENDADVLDRLDRQQNKTEYIRQLIRSDIKLNK